MAQPRVITVLAMRRVTQSTAAAAAAAAEDDGRRAMRDPNLPSRNRALRPI
jgi:hypothetical protein